MKSHEVEYFNEKNELVVERAFKQGEVVEGQKLNTLAKKMVKQLLHETSKKKGIPW